MPCSWGSGWRPTGNHVWHILFRHRSLFRPAISPSQSAWSLNANPASTFLVAHSTHLHPPAAFTDGYGSKLRIQGNLQRFLAQSPRTVQKFRGCFGRYFYHFRQFPSCFNKCGDCIQHHAPIYCRQLLGLSTLVVLYQDYRLNTTLVLRLFFCTHSVCGKFLSAATICRWVDQRRLSVMNVLYGFKSPLMPSFSVL